MGLPCRKHTKEKLTDWENKYGYEWRGKDYMLVWIGIGIFVCLLSLGIGGCQYISH